jgi:sugar lactone lactonase YvrE
MGTRVLYEGLAFGEGPRWHDGRLWLSDMHAHKVLAIDLDGSAEEICEVPNRPSGLGWLPDGRMLVVSMTDRRLLRMEPSGALTEHADLSSVATFDCNDMVVDGAGRAYVGNFGFDLHNQAAPTSAAMALVQPDGRVETAAEGLDFPNGTVITPDGATLIVGESFGRRLTAFSIGADGRLSDRRVFADLGSSIPDGICLDAEGAVWSADPRGNCCIRVADGGEVLDRVDVDRGCYACMLGGPDRRTLFMLTARTSSPAEAVAARDGRVEVVEVSVAGSGTP